MDAGLERYLNAILALLVLNVGLTAAVYLDLALDSLVSVAVLAVILAAVGIPVKVFASYLGG